MIRSFWGLVFLNNLILITFCLTQLVNGIILSIITMSLHYCSFAPNRKQKDSQETDSIKKQLVETNNGKDITIVIAMDTKNE